MLEDEIELVNSVMESSMVWSHQRKAWYKVKEALAQQPQDTQTNNDYEKCARELINLMKMENDYKWSHKMTIDILKKYFTYD